jgi:hypothetical membrane protein
MDAWLCFAKGDFDRPFLQRYLTVVGGIYWFLILLCWGKFPEHKFSIMSNTYSALGSYDQNNNPQWWWLFSVAMTFWGIATIPVVFYNFRRLATISAWAAGVGAFFMMLGGIGISLVGIFPDAAGTTLGNHSIREVHKYVALIGAGGYLLSAVWFGGMLVTDALKEGYGDFEHKWFIPPYAVLGSVFGTGVYFLLQWESVYANLKAAAIAAGREVPGHFGAALNTRYSFPLWENLTIWSLFLFIVWFALALPEEVPNGDRY